MSWPFLMILMPDGRQSGFLFARFLYSGTARYPTVVLTSFLKALYVFTEKEETTKERSSFIYKKYGEREKAILDNKKINLITINKFCYKRSFNIVRVCF